MATFMQRGDPVRLLYRRLFIVLLLALIAVLIRGVWGVYIKEHESRILRREAQLQLDDLREREASLREEIASLKSDRGREAILREEYELAKEGESLIIIVEPDVRPPPKESRARELLHKALFWWY